MAIPGEKRGSTFVKRIAQDVAATHAQETARLRAIGSALFSAGVPIGSLGVPRRRPPTEIAKGEQVDLKTTAQAIIDAETTQLASMRKRLNSQL